MIDAPRLVHSDCPVISLPARTAKGLSAVTGGLGTCAAASAGQLEALCKNTTSGNPEACASRLSASPMTLGREA